MNDNSYAFKVLHWSVLYYSIFKGTVLAKYRILQQQPKSLPFLKMDCLLLSRKSTPYNIINKMVYCIHMTCGAPRDVNEN